jgi:hypothetical protein
MFRQTFILILLIGAMLAMAGCIVVPVRSGAVNHRPDRRDSDHKTVVVAGPPVLFISSDDPDLIVIPGTYVYVIDESDDDVYFYGGVWWRFWSRSWYRSDSFRGKWVEVEVRHVPRQVTHLPSGWKNKRRNAPRAKWRDTRDHWKKWENDKHWEKKKWHR